MDPDRHAAADGLSAKARGSAVSGAGAAAIANVRGDGKGDGKGSGHGVTGVRDPDDAVDVATDRSASRSSLMWKSR